MLSVEKLFPMAKTLSDFGGVAVKGLAAGAVASVVAVVSAVIIVVASLAVVVVASVVASAVVPVVFPQDTESSSMAADKHKLNSLWIFIKTSSLIG